jgi:hypothetical protein
MKHDNTVSFYRESGFFFCFFSLLISFHRRKGSSAPKYEHPEMFMLPRMLQPASANPSCVKVHNQSSCYFTTLQFRDSLWHLRNREDFIYRFEFALQSVRDAA